MMQRIRNVIKTANKKARNLDENYTPDSQGLQKKRRKKEQLCRRYPIFSKNQGVCDDPQSIESHMKGLENELKKAKPRDHLLLPLMKSTFSVRRDWIVDGAESVASILKQYPALSRLAVVRF